MSEVDHLTKLKERLMEFSLRNLRLFRALPANEEARVFGRQLLRSSSSVGANHREACRARSGAEFTAKLGICLQELDETAYWLELIERSELLSSKQIGMLKQECNELTAILVTVIKRSKSEREPEF